MVFLIETGRKVGRTGRIKVRFAEDVNIVEYQTIMECPTGRGLCGYRVGYMMSTSFVFESERMGQNA